MSDAELAEIEARANAATPGPWINCGYQIDDANGVVFCREQTVGDYFADCRFTSSAAFITASRTDVPALCAEIRRLRKICADTLPFAEEALRAGLEFDEATTNEIIASHRTIQALRSALS